MRMQHRAVAMSAVALAATVLAGCEKPAPGVTAWSGTNSEHVEAFCWEFEDGVALSAQSCAEAGLAAAQQGEGIAILEVVPDSTFGVSVDKAVARAGWSMLIDGQTIAAGLTETYHKFDFPELPPGDEGHTLQVVAAAEGSGNRGYWFFRLVGR